MPINILLVNFYQRCLELYYLKFPKTYFGGASRPDVNSIFAL